MANAQRRHHAEIKSTRAGCIVTICRHEPMSLVRSTITSIRAPAWSAMQIEGLQEWRDWIALWAGPEAGTEPLYELVSKIFSKIFFLGRLSVDEIIFEKHLLKHRRYYGLTTTKDGTPDRVTIILDPDDVRQSAEHRADLGRAGNGQSWFYLASHVEAVARRHLAEVGRVSVWRSMSVVGRPEYIPTASDWKELLDGFTVADLSDLVSAWFCVRDRYFMDLLIFSSAQYSLGVEDVVSSTVERWIGGMMDLRCKQRDGLLTADERNDLEDMEGQLRRQCYDCAAGNHHHQFADKHFVPVSWAQDEQWKHNQRRKLLGDAAYFND